MTGKKAPEALCFRPKVRNVKVPIPEGGDKLQLGPANIPIVNRQRVLGLNIATEPDSSLFSEKGGQKTFLKQSQNIIDKYGYYLEPNIDTYKSLAYRFQTLKDQQTPSRLALAVGSYFGGKLRFCASFYFLRSTKKQLDTIRFYYSMALSSILGLTAYETVGASACRSQSVAESSESYKHLLRITGQPSIRSMAVQDATTFIRQAALINADWFLPEGDRLKDKEIKRREEVLGENKKFYPKFCAKAKDGSLVYDCWKMAKGGAYWGSSPTAEKELTKTASYPKKTIKKGTRVFERFWQLAGERVVINQTKSHTQGVSGRLLKSKFFQNLALWKLTTVG